MVAKYGILKIERVFEGTYTKEQKFSTNKFSSKMLSNENTPKRLLL